MKQLETKDPNKYIHCIWYCWQGTRFEESEVKIINKLSELYTFKKLPIIIVYTNAIDQSQVKSAKDIIKNTYNLENDIINILAKETQIKDTKDSIKPYNLDKLKEKSFELAQSAVNSSYSEGVLNELKNHFKEKLNSFEKVCENKILNESKNFVNTQIQKIEIERVHKKCIFIIFKLLMEFIFLGQDLDDESNEYENYINANFEKGKNDYYINDNDLSNFENDINQIIEKEKNPNEFIELFDNENCEKKNEYKYNNNNKDEKNQIHEDESNQNEEKKNFEKDNKKDNEINNNNNNCFINATGKNLDESDKKENIKCTINENNENNKKQSTNKNNEKKIENKDIEYDKIQADEKKVEVKSDEKKEKLELEKLNKDIEERNYEGNDKINDKLEIKNESENKNNGTFEIQFLELKTKESLKNNIISLKKFVVEYLNETDKNYNKKIDEIANNYLDELNNKILLLRFNLASEYQGLFNLSNSNIDLKEELKKYISDTFYNKIELSLLKNSINFLIDLFLKKITEYFKNLYLQEISKQDIKNHILDIIKFNNIKVQEQIKKYNEIMKNDNKKIEEISVPIEKKDLSISKDIQNLRDLDSDNSENENEIE